MVKLASMRKALLLVSMTLSFTLSACGGNSNVYQAQDEAKQGCEILFREGNYSDLDNEVEDHFKAAGRLVDTYYDILGYFYVVKYSGLNPNYPKKWTSEYKFKVDSFCSNLVD